MFGTGHSSFFMSDHLSGILCDKKRNLPRVVVRELTRKMVGSTVYQGMQAELFFIEQHRTLEKSAVTLMGLRSQRLFWESERAFANLMNFIHSCSGVNTGMYIPFIWLDVSVI